MKKADFEKVLNNCPHIVPVFKVIKVPDWAIGKIEDCAIMWYNTETRSMTDLDGYQYDLGSSYVKFISYQTITGGRDNLILSAY